MCVQSQNSCEWVTTEIPGSFEHTPGTEATTFITVTRLVGDKLRTTPEDVVFFMIIGMYLLRRSFVPNMSDIGGLASTNRHR